MLEEAMFGSSPAVADTMRDDAAFVPDGFVSGVNVSGV
jgi:hypothetical protein